MEESGGEKKREPEKRPLVFTDCNNPIGKMTFTLQFLDDFFSCYCASLSDLTLFQGLSWSGRTNLPRVRENSSKDCLRSSYSSLVFFFFFNPACSFVPSLRTESLEPAISDRTSGVKELLDP